MWCNDYISPWGRSVEVAVKQPLTVEPSDTTVDCKSTAKLASVPTASAKNFNIFEN